MQGFLKEEEILENNKQILFTIVKRSLWGNAAGIANEEIYSEMRHHAIAALPAFCLSSLGLPPELEKEWKKYTLQQISFYTQSCYEQSKLPISVPYVILKGTSAAKYYPHPECRTMGDIDIMTRREDFDTACKQLVGGGYRINNDIYKEISLSKNNIHIDLHRQFASLNNPDYVKFLDDLIIENINPSHALPDPVNGLVLLNHINQHLEGGLGLRQIIDWMMFVNQCLPDEKWPEFYELVKKIHLEKLAAVCTRMCEIYLGLPHREWCADADTALCEQLMDYVLACGNFGNKKKSDTDISENVFTHARTPKSAFRLLQRQGLVNWKAAKKHKPLRPFAWIYQLFRYASKGLKRDHAISKVMAEYASSREKAALLDALGANILAKGLVTYKDGKYVKD